MKTEYARQLDVYSTDQSVEKCKIFFEKYWLTKDELKVSWNKLKELIFNSTAESLPDLMFRNGFLVYPTVARSIFNSEKDFNLLQECWEVTGDKSFVIIQNDKSRVKSFNLDENKYEQEPLIRFKFPSDISWQDLKSEPMSIDMHTGDFYVFGDSGSWGRYVSTEYVEPIEQNHSNAYTDPLKLYFPLNITGFKKEYSNLFCSALFNLWKEELSLYPEQQITREKVFNRWLPIAYKNLIPHKWR